MAIRFFDPSELPLQQQFSARQRFVTYQAGATPEMAQRISTMFSTNPNLRPGTGLSLVRAGVDPEGPIARAAVKAEAQRRQSKGFGWHSIGDVVAGGVDKVSNAIGKTAGGSYGVVKGVSRGAFIGLEALPQAIQGEFRNNVADGDLSIGETLGVLNPLNLDFSQTTAAAGTSQIIDSFQESRPLRGLDYGSGFFPGGEVKTEQARRARAAAPLIDNHAVSLGRHSAKQFFEPGSKQYGLMSGVIDGGLLLAADPTNFVGGGVAKLGSAGVREGTERGRNFTAVSQGNVVRETAVEMTPARRTAQAFGRGDLTAGEFLERAGRYGSENPGVQRVLKSRDEGLIAADEAREAVTEMRSRIAVEAGIVDGVRKTVLSDVANDWLTRNEQGRRSVRAFAKTTSVAELRRATDKQVDVETLAQLALAKDDNEVISVIGPLLGTSIRAKPGVSATDEAIANGETGFKVAVKKARASSRWLSLMPHSAVDLDDLDDVVEQIDRLGATVKMPLADRDAFVNRLAYTRNRNERFAVTKDFMRAIQDDVLKDVPSLRIDAQQRKALTRLYGAFDDIEQFRTFALDELGDPMKVPGAPVLRVGDTEQALASPHLLSEHIGQYMPLPDAQELRRATSKTMQTLSKIPGATRTTDALIVTGDTITKVFKAGALARVAYPIRVIAEEQARMAASGLHSAYAHPLSYLSVMVGRSATNDINDDPFTAAKELGDAMSAGSAGMFGQQGKIKLPGKVAVDRTNPDFARALVDNLAEYHGDAVAQRVARGGLGAGDRTPNPLPGVDGIKDWFYSGTGRTFREQLATGADTRGADATRRAIFTKKFDPDDALNSADGYVDSIVERLRVATNGDTRLMQAVASGVIDGVPLMRQIGPKRFEPNRAAIAKVQAILDEGPDIGPNFAKGDVFMTAKQQDPTGGALMRKYDKAVETMFEYLMSKPTNKLSRSPSFRQFYWKRQGELLQYMQPEVQQAAITVAKQEGLPKPVIKRMEQAAARRSGELTAAEADQLSKAFGVDSTRKLLYDLHDRGQFWDATRIIFPFGSAFQEVAQTWGRIGLQENPMVLRRGQQLVNGLRSANIDGEDEGVFFTDANGEETFALPFSGWINEKVSGVDAQFTAPVKGLNVFGSSVIPGLGPVITMPLSKVIPNRPEYQDIQELLFPFGEKEYEDGAMGGFAGDVVTPTWLKKIVTAATADPEDHRVFANHVAYSSRYLLSTGRYDMDTAEGKDRLEQDSIAAARKLFMLRGLAQIWSPSAPSPEYVAKDKDGKGLVQVRLVEEYQKLLNADYRTATEKFVEKFGEGAILSVVGRTSGGAPPTEDTNDFAQRNSDTVRTHRDVYGFFLERGGEFKYQAYKDQIATGERKTVTVKESMEIANQRLGQMVYNQYKAQVGDSPTAEQKAWLGDIRDRIEVDFPGFNPTPANLRDSKLLISKLVAAAKDPVLADTEAGQGLTRYLDAREQAIAEAKNRGLKTFTNAKSAKDLREYLRDYATQVEQEYPAFGELFERTFNREMIADGTD